MRFRRLCPQGFGVTLRDGEVDKWEWRPGHAARPRDARDCRPAQRERCHFGRSSRLRPMGTPDVPDMMSKGCRLQS